MKILFSRISILLVVLSRSISTTSVQLSHRPPRHRRGSSVGLPSSRKDPDAHQAEHEKFLYSRRNTDDSSVTTTFDTTFHSSPGPTASASLRREGPFPRHSQHAEIDEELFFWKLKKNHRSSNTAVTTFGHNTRTSDVSAVPDEEGQGRKVKQKKSKGEKIDAVSDRATIKKHPPSKKISYYLSPVQKLPDNGSFSGHHIIHQQHQRQQNGNKHLKESNYPHHFKRATEVEIDGQSRHEGPSLFVEESPPRKNHGLDPNASTGGASIARQFYGSKGTKERSTAVVVKKQQDHWAEEVQQTHICQNNEAPIRIEIVQQSDSYPSETYWSVTDISGMVAILSSSIFWKEEILQGLRNAIYVTTLCTDSRKCFRFAIHDSSAGDGICCSSVGFGLVKVVYNNRIVVLEGTREFEATVESTLFGDGCRSSQSSTESLPKMSLSKLKPKLGVDSVGDGGIGNPSMNTGFLSTKAKSAASMPISTGERNGGKRLLQKKERLDSAQPFITHDFVKMRSLSRPFMKASRNSGIMTETSSLSASPRTEDNRLATLQNHHGTLQTHLSTTPCSDNNNLVPIQIEIQTDEYPNETSWKLYLRPSNLSYSAPDGSYEKKDSLYIESFCVDPSSCFQFVIFDFYGDGLCCGGGDGWYKVFFNNVLVAEGGEFFYSEASALFGNGCPAPSTVSPSSSFSNIPTTSSAPTSSGSPSNLPSNLPSTSQTFSPSISSSPSLSLSPTQKPSQLPTVSPSLSLSPTNKPSQLPTVPPSALSSTSPTMNPSDSLPTDKPSDSLSPSIISDVPSSAPTQTMDFIAVDENNRRYFPRLSLRPEGSFSYAPIINCTAPANEERVGCIGVIRTIPALVPPAWAGSLHSKPPHCKLNADGSSKCEMNIPRSTTNMHDTTNLYTRQDEAAERMKLFALPTEGVMDTTSIAIADINGDGAIDIVVGNSNGSNQVLLNQNDGSFSEAVDLHRGRMDTKSIAAADINGDGTIDIVIGNSKQNNQVMFNQGDGSFSKAKDLPGGEMDTTTIAVGDINGDGTIDIIVGNVKQKNQLLLNDGDGSFSKALDLPGGAMETQSIAVADINGDGAIDIIVGNWIQNNQALLNDGGGSFSKVFNLPGGGIMRSQAVAVADINGDGAIDIIVGNWRQNNQVLMNQNGESFNTSFSTGFVLPGGSSETSSIAVADINGDGRIDIIVGNVGKSNEVLLNEGHGLFSKALDLPGGVMDSWSIAVADVNGDSTVDIIVGNKNQTNEVLLNQIYGSFSETFDLPGGNMRSQAIAVADMNGDGRMDIVAGNRAQNNQVLFNLGDGSFSEALDLPGGIRNTRSIAVADMNGDGNIDIIVGNRENVNQLLLNDGDGSFSEALDPLPGGVLDTWSIAVADINGDSAIDIIVGNRFQRNMNVRNQVLFNQGDGSFREAVDLPGGGMDTRSIAVSDINGDGKIDVLVGIRNKNNHLLLSNGDGSFNEPVDLPDGGMDTRAIAVGDMNGDGKIDVLFGNRNQKNQLLLNYGDGSLSEALDLPGGEMETQSIVVADINGDGAMDIIVGNRYQNNQVLINQGGSSNETLAFLVFDDTDHTLSSFSVSAADFDSDGMIDLVIGNYGSANHLSTFLPCPRGGAQIHQASWCYNCPSFMGNLYPFQRRFCKECLPDRVQVQNGIEQVCIQCVLGERLLGDDTCVSCAAGTYYDSLLDRKENNMTTWYDTRCKACPEGQYSNNQFPAIDGCFKCSPGTYQPKKGSTGCNVCKKGQYQTKEGQSSCEACGKGGYCNATSVVGGGYAPCPPGTYNDQVGMSTIDSCLKCPQGTYSIETGAKSIETCLPCPQGTFGNETGQTGCISCAAGTYQNTTNQTLCMKCSAGLYADKPGLTECIKCPHRLDSTEGDIICHFCSKGFYLNDSFSTSVTDVFKSPSEHCLKCPMLSDETCPFKNTSLQALKVSPEYWRASLNTSRIYQCRMKETCTPVQDLSITDQGDNTGQYCAEGHRGPLCEVCVKQEESYFSYLTGKCLKCPPWSRVIAIQSSLLVFAVLLFYMVLTLAPSRLSSLASLISSLSLQAKFKILLSFYQVVSSLDTVYGVRISSEFVSWLAIFQLFSLDIFDLIGVPKSCIGSMTQQLIVGATWPYILIFLGGIGVCGHILLLMIKRQGSTATYVQVSGRDEVDPDDRRFANTLIKVGMKHLTYVVIIVLYVALPIVSRSIFDAIKCRALTITDYGEPPYEQSFLLVNMDIECNVHSDEQFRDMQGMFWFFFALWPVFTPLCFLTMLVFARNAIRTNSITALADACRFLWADYNESVWFWDVIDTWRKIFLCGCIMFIDKEEGSTKLLRLVIASIISGAYLGFLAISQPYKQKHDLYLAFVGNLLLLSCFNVGIILQLCNQDQDDGENNDTCDKFIGLSLDSFRASVVIISMLGGMFIITIGFLAVLAVNKIQEPSVFLAASGQSPNLEMPEDCNYHAFMSHVWSTGQAKTHAIVRKLRLHLPKLRIWLDVNDLHDITKLEECVAEAAVFILYYSKGYFRSRNCRREIYAAAQLGKPIIVLYEGNASVIEALCAECNTYCTDPESPGPSALLKYMFNDDPSAMSDDYVPPILWLDLGTFCAAALNLIYLRLLSHLPYYQKNPRELNNGIVVPGEIGPLKIDFEVNVLVCGVNEGSEELAREVNSLLSSVRRSSGATPLMSSFLFSSRRESLLGINIIEAEEYFEQQNNEINGAPCPPDALEVAEEKLTGISVLLLYLNKHFFADAEESVLTDVIQSSIDDPNINIILVHEQDIAKGGCPFDLFFQQVPQHLIDPPNQLFKNMAIPLYSLKEYRIISLRKIIHQFRTVLVP